MNDEELSDKGQQRINRANKNSWIISGALLWLAGGPLCGVAGALLGGVAYDGLDITIFNYRLNIKYVRF